jgi:hypothetical protein
MAVGLVMMLSTAAAWVPLLKENWMKTLREPQ